jgi:hypothetical protein
MLLAQLICSWLYWNMNNKCQWDCCQLQSCSNQQLSRYKPPTENCNNTPLIGLSPESMPGEPNAHVQVMEQPSLTWFETLNEVRQKGDAGLFAQNRGNAMLRYREKKKNRRHDANTFYSSVCILSLFSSFQFVSLNGVLNHEQIW